MFGLGAPEIIGIVLVVLLLFGAKKIPEVMRGLGKGLREFKTASREAVNEIQSIVEEEPEDKPAETESQQ